MKLAKAFFGLVLVALMAGCVTSSNQVQPSGTKDSLAQSGPVKSSADPNEIICEMQRPVGSNIPERVCRTRASAEGDRDATQIMLQTINNKSGLRGN